MQKLRQYFIAFSLPLILLSFAMLAMNIYPFGQISWRVSDAISQYPAFFEGLRNFHFFTFNIGMGMNYYPIFTTYLASPLNLLYFFFKKENFDLFFVILILLKVGLIGLTMNILLNYKRKYSSESLIFSTIYALSGFVTLYYFNYQFLDAVYMLPLVMMGLQKLVKENKYAMYYITLSLTIIIHYYTGYMVCLFSLIYFFYLLYNEEIEKKAKRKRIKTFFGISLLCGLTASFILIPTAFSFMQGRSGYFNIADVISLNKNAFSIFYNFMPGSTITNDLSNLSAPVYVSIFVIITVLLGILSKVRKSKSTLVVIFIYIVSLMLNFVYIVWHFGQMPVGNPGRFVFCFNAFLILVSYEFYLNKTIKISLKRKWIIGIISSMVVILSFFWKNLVIFKSPLIMENACLITLFFGIVLIFIYVLLIFNNRWRIFMNFIIFLELFINLVWNLNVDLSYTNYKNLNVHNRYNNVIKTDKIISLLKNDNLIRKDGFYLYNSGLLYNYNSISFYSSIYNKNLTNFLKKLNISRVYDHNINYKSNILSDAFLGVKYLLFEEQNEIFENTYVVESVGFLGSQKIKNDLINDMSILDTLNSLTDNKYTLELKTLKPKVELSNIKIFNNMYSIDDLSKDGKVNLIYHIPEDCIAQIDYGKGTSFVNFEKKVTKSVLELTHLYINEKEVSNIYELNKGDIVKLEINIPKDLEVINNSIGFFEYVNQDKFLNVIKEINENKVEGINVKSNGFIGKFTSTKDKNLVILTIPYDENVTIKIDGKNQNYYMILNGLIGFDTLEGEHTIEFIYKIKGLKIGIVLSVTSVAIFALKILSDSVKIKRKSS